MNQSMHLLPPSKNVCPVCAIKHPSDQPHDYESLYYQMRFRMAHGRDATWADAMAHCTTEVQERWKRALESFGIRFTGPADGEVIADPPHDSLHMLVGNVDVEP